MTFCNTSYISHDILHIYTVIGRVVDYSQNVRMYKTFLALCPHESSECPAHADSQDHFLAGPRTLLARDSVRERVFNYFGQWVCQRPAPKCVPNLTVFPR